jgi:hypothetical protein
LVELTNHSATDPRIIRYQPVLKAKAPRLLIKVAESVPLNDNVTLTQRARVEFTSVSGTDIRAVEILDRLETLFDFTDNKSYYDFSGGNIATFGVMFKLRNEPVILTGDDVWRAEMEVEIIWSKISCPS